MKSSAHHPAAFEGLIYLSFAYLLTGLGFLFFAYVCLCAYCGVDMDPQCWDTQASLAGLGVH